MSINLWICTSITLTFLTPLITLAQEKQDSVKMLDELIVTESRDFLRNTRMGFHSFSTEKIKTIPVIFGEPDIIKVFHTLPGVSAGLEGFSGLYVRGGENDQNLFLLDNLPLHNISHLGGVFSTFNANSIRNADFYKSTFPARFGGKISSVTDLRLSTPGMERTEGSVTIGLISGNIFLATPLKKQNTSLAVSLRRTWLDVVTAPALAILNTTTRREGKKLTGNYYFMDGSVRLDHIWKPGLSSSVVGFYSRDSFKIGEEHFSSDDSGSDPDDISDYHSKDIIGMKWSSYGVLGNFSASLSKGLLSVNAYWSGTSARQEEIYSKTYTNESSKNSNDSYNFLNEWGISQTFSLPISSRFDLSAGMNQTLKRYNPERREILKAERDVIFSSSSCPDAVSAGEFSAFAEGNWEPTDWFSMTAGFRLQSYISANRKVLLPEPRISIRLSPFGSLSIKAGYSRSSQFMQQVSSNYIAVPTDSWLPTGSIFSPLKSDSYSIGAYGLVSNSLRFSGELWYRNMKGVAEYKEGISIYNPDLNWADKITFGMGWAYGLDISIGRTFGNVSADISYGLMWSWRKFNDLNQGKRFPAKFDNRHKIDISASWKINENMTLNAQWQFMSGNRTTIALYNIDLPNHFFPDAPFERPADKGKGDYTGAGFLGERNNVRLPAFHRLNLSLTIDGKLKSGRRYSWNFGLYNAYCHMNAFTVTKEHLYVVDKENPLWHRNFQVFSLIPILPSVSYTLYF